MFHSNNPRCVTKAVRCFESGVIGIRLYPFGWSSDATMRRLGCMSHSCTSMTDPIGHASRTVLSFTSRKSRHTRNLPPCRTTTNLHAHDGVLGRMRPFLSNISMYSSTAFFCSSASLAGLCRVGRMSGSGVSLTGCSGSQSFLFGSSTTCVNGSPGSHSCLWNCSTKSGSLFITVLISAFVVHPFVRSFSRLFSHMPVIDASTRL